MGLNEKMEQGIQIDSRDIKKHRNDILRMVSEIVFEKCSLSDAVKEDMLNFIEKFHVTDAELKIKGLKEADMVERLQKCKKRKS